MLTNVAAVKRELRQTDIYPDAGDDAFILERIDTAVSRTHAEAGRWFAPHIDTMYYDALPMDRGGLIDGKTLYLAGEPLLELQGVAVLGEDKTLSDYTAKPQSNAPKWRIVGEWQPLYDDDAEDAISITGVWGYKETLNDAWVSSNDSLQADISDSDAVLTVADADGEDAFFREPRFSPGMLIRIDSEYLQIRKVTVNTLSCIRAFNNSTATAHGSGTAIKIWQPEASIALGVTRWATLMYKRRAEFARREVEGMNAKEYPADMPEDFRRTLARYTTIPQLRRVGNRR